VVTASNEASLRTTVLELVRSARRRLLVASYGFDVDHDVVQAIEEQARAGVQVTVLTRPRPAVAAAVLRLASAGATVLAHDKLHAKAIVADDCGLVMTANLQSHGLDGGFEVGIQLDRDASKALAETLDDWTRRFPWRFTPNPDRSGHLGEVCLVDKGLRTGRRTVEEERTVTLDPVIASSALDLESAPTPDLAPPRERERFFQRIRYEWDVMPPRLPKKATELRQEVMRTKRGKDGREKEVRGKESYDPPVYSHGGQKLVLLSTPDKLQAAKRLARELGATVVIP
jgi:cardiolipin synthase